MNQKKESTTAANTDSNTKVNDAVRVVSVFVGNKTASEAFNNAAVKKILYDKEKVS